MSSSAAEEIDALIQDVAAASKIPTKSRGANIKPTVASLTSLVYENGLLPNALEELVGLLVTPSHLDQASLAAIARNLYPVARVSRQVTIRVIGALGHGNLKPSLNLQVALLKWLIMIHHVLETPAVLAQAYGVLFNLLDTAAIRPNVCHLLALITRRKHVKPFRIQALLNLSRQTANDPYLIGLLRVFKDYYPEIILGELVRGKASAFKHPDISWKERLQEIQDAYALQAEKNSRGALDGFQVNRATGRAQGRRVVPVVHTSHVNENAVTLEEIENVTGFVQNMDRIELPNQLVAVLADPLLQKLLLLRPNAEAYQRVANWLSSVLQNVIDGDADEATLWEVLDVVKEFVVQSKSVPPVLLNFFARFFQQWNGSGQRSYILQILAYAPLLEFQDFYEHILQPLELAVLDNTPGSQVDILTLYTDILRHWIAILQSNDPIPAHANTSLTALIRHTGQLSLTLLQTSPTESVNAAIVEFYEQAIHLVNDDRLKYYIRIELPPSELIYSFLFSGSVTTISRLCDILACYKKGFEMAMSTKARNDGSNRIDALSYDRAYVNLYNGYLMDICNCFWRSRAFSDADTNSHGCMIPRPAVSKLTSYVSSVDKTFTLPSLFSLSYSPVLCLQSIHSVRDLEDAAIANDSTIRTRHAGPVTQASLSKLATSGGIQLSWQEYRIEVLRSLAEKNLGGIAELLKNTMTVLKKSMDATPRARAKMLSQDFS
ncbi:mis6 domain-containing protein [Trichoderma breve]|uniref:Mis6 domain-containing protein n=1 Tax=Trichoderma breve TaxID=2034170 RepID=A0A9W9B4Q0_9HYPO|nr:mis6 domain-containing protein [Trichoderma breve]KAJ4856227.1 mis6 domain-containing protein [Trichoderma breve]